MQTLDWLVIAVGAASAALIGWYFFRAEGGVGQAAIASTGGSGRQEVVVTVRGGYSPATIRASAGQPLRMVFDRQETASCSEEVVFPDFGIRRFLPPHERTTVEVTPPAAGSYEFTCGMGMLHGRVIAE